jgi:hypothetical protein
MKEWFKALLKDFDFRKSIQYQLKLSIVVLIVWGLTYVIVFDPKGGRVGVFIGEQAEKYEKENQPEETLEWIVLVVNPALREKLWAKYEGANEAEREEAFAAILVMLEEIQGDQGKHLAEGIIQRSESTRSREHFKKLLEALGALAEKFKEALPPVGAFSARALKSRSKAEALLVQTLLNKLRATIGESPLNYCLDVQDRKSAKECAAQLAKNGNKKDKDTVWKFSQTTGGVEGQEAMLALAEERDVRPRGEIPKYLNSVKATDVQFALQLIRHYQAVEYVSKLEKARSTTFNSQLKSEIEMTLQFLSMDLSRATNGQRLPAGSGSP